MVPRKTLGKFIPQGLPTSVSAILAVSLVVILAWQKGSFDPASISAYASPPLPHLPSELHTTAPAWAILQAHEAGTGRQVQPIATRVSPEPPRDLEFWKSQDGEDEHAWNHFFYSVVNGTMLEVGALDGLLISTSHGYERDLGWRSIHIEPSPTNYKNLIANRPKALNINAALCSQRQIVHFADQRETSGILEFMPQTFIERFYPHLAGNTKQFNNYPAIACIPMRDLLEAFNIRHIDFFVLDVEGAELEVVKSIDFSRVSFGVVAVETDGHNPEKDAEVIRYFTQAGMTVVPGDKGGRNTWLMSRDFVPSKAPHVQ